MTRRFWQRRRLLSFGGRNSYNEMYSVLQERGLVSETQMARCAENLHFTLDYRDLAACTVFFESVVED